VRGTTEESPFKNITNLTKQHWLTNERFFASLRMTKISSGDTSG
jgi:hypothetical protein